MKRFVVTQGQTDVQILRAALGVEAGDPDIQFRAGGGWSAADAYARSLLIDNKGDVALVVDADTTDPNVADDRKRFLRQSLGTVAPRPRKCMVVVVVPEIEQLLFRCKSCLEKVVGGPIGDKVLAEGRVRPEATLERLLAGTAAPIDFAERLRRVDWTPLHAEAEVAALREFLCLTDRAVSAAA